mgnify:FL=1
MQTITEETKRKVVKLHIQDGRTIASLAAEYGVCHATVSNWIRAYREECQTNDVAKSENNLMQEVRQLQKKLAEAEKGMTQGDLAEMVGVSRQTISSIETGQFNPTAKLALILCIALDKKFEELFYFD